MRVIVTRQGPIDRHQPGDDVTGLYGGEKLTRLVKEGFLRRDYHKDEAEDQEAELANAPAATDAPDYGAHSDNRSEEL